MEKAIRADLPQARIRALRPQHLVATRAAQTRPDLVVFNASARDATTQRRLIQHVWATVVVVELSATESRALVWRPPSDVEVVEVGPGFLGPFLPARSVTVAPPPRLLPALRFVGYAAVLVDVLAGLANDQPPVMLVGFVALAGLIAHLYRQRQEELCAA
jgi:hypothetical protein